MQGNGGEEVKFFSEAEFRCKGIGCCDHSDGHMDPIFLAMIDAAREISECPYEITSGHRCPRHNQDVGSTTNNHTSGKAADIKAVDSHSRMKIVEGLVKAGFQRIGIDFMRGFIHADIMEGEALWGY
jgi:uncharacterized protein YcbK (DUF882 family)